MKHQHAAIAALFSLVASACGGASESVEPAAPIADRGRTEASEGPAPLTFDVFTAGEPGFLVTSTLVMGERDAILIDAQFNLSSARDLAAWIADKGVNLTAIVVTHAHPDHYFGAEAVLDAFPGTPIYATAEVIEHMRELGPAKLAYWGPIYGDDLTTSPVVPSELANNTLDLEGRTLEIIAVHADAHVTNVVHVPSIDLVVAADLAFSDVHVWLADASTSEARAAWLSSIDRIAALAPASVVPGHLGPNGVTTPSVLTETRDYIVAFERSLAGAASPADLIASMTALYPDRALPIILELAAGAGF